MRVKLILAREECPPGSVLFIIDRKSEVEVHGGVSSSYGAFGVYKGAIYGSIFSALHDAVDDIVKAKPSEVLVFSRSLNYLKAVAYRLKAHGVEYEWDIRD